MKSQAPWLFFSPPLTPRRKRGPWTKPHLCQAPRGTQSQEQADRCTRSIGILGIGDESRRVSHALDTFSDLVDRYGCDLQEGVALRTDFAQEASIGGAYAVATLARDTHSGSPAVLTALLVSCGGLVCWSFRPTCRPHSLTFTTPPLCCLGYFWGDYIIPLLWGLS